VEEGRVDEIRRCIGCLHCIKSFTENAGMNLVAGRPGECALNPEVGHEAEWKLPEDGNGRSAVVIGAGPSGLKAAEVLARRGFAVSVFEKDERAGGQVITASTCLHKGKLYWCVEDLLASLKALGVEVKTGVNLSAEEIAAMNPHAVVIATGGTAVVPRSIPGTDLPTVCTAPDIIMGREHIENSDVVVVGSGMTGLETTEILNEAGNRVTVVEMADEIAPGTWFQLIDDEMSRIEPFGTKFMTGKRLMKIEESQVILEDTQTSELTRVKADRVVLSMGVRPVDALYRSLKARNVNVYKVGDAVSSGTIADAVHSGYDVAVSIR
jgi:NADPH-dependent 2,4-dienoyl-CoA reductase/sulfur reductase-like enzyme